MALRRDFILAGLTKARLLELGVDFDVKNQAKDRKEVVAQSLANSRRFTTDELLAYLTFLELKNVCVTAGITSTGRSKADYTAAIINAPSLTREARSKLNIKRKKEKTVKSVPSNNVAADKEDEKVLEKKQQRINEAKNISAHEPASDFVLCIHCKARVKEKNLKKHIRRVHTKNQSKHPKRRKGSNHRLKGSKAGKSSKDLRFLIDENEVSKLPLQKIRSLIKRLEKEDNMPVGKRKKGILHVSLGNLKKEYSRRISKSRGPNFVQGGLPSLGKRR